MRHPFKLLVVLVVALAACGGTADTTTTTTGPAPTTTQPEVETPEALRLSYGLEAGTTFTYEVDLDQRIEMTTTGDATALGEEGIPGDLSMRAFGTTTFSFVVAEGPVDETYEVTITGDFSGIELSGTMDGEPVDPEKIPDFAAVEPFEMTVVVDEQGNPVSEGEDPGDILGGLFGGLEGFGDLGASGLDPGRFFGPPLSDDEVTVGDSWSETVEIPMFGEGEPATSTVASVVSRADRVDGVDVLVIDTTTTTSAISFDLAELLIGMFEAFMPTDATAEERAEMEALTADLRFLFELDPSESTMTTWFDPEAGVSRRAEFAGANRFSMDINMPDEETGELLAFGMVMHISQMMDYRLVGAPGA
jgi:hypothetical protein